MPSLSISTLVGVSNSSTPSPISSNAPKYSAKFCAARLRTPKVNTTHASFRSQYESQDMIQIGEWQNGEGCPASMFSGGLAREAACDIIRQDFFVRQPEDHRCCDNPQTLMQAL